MRDYIAFGITWVILSILGDLGAQKLGQHFYYFVASSQGEDSQNAAAFILLVAVPVFIFVVLMLIYTMLRFRRRHQDASKSVSQTKHNRVYIGLWIGASLVINLFLFIHPTASAQQEYFKEAQQYNSNPNTLEVDVVARQWEWFFSYPQYGITQAVDANGNSVLVLPVDRPVKFVLRSYDPNHSYDSEVDVIHSFWIPSFGIKTDVIPGETRYEYIDPTVITSTATNQMTRVQCAEVCGPGHPFMEADVSVVSSSDFDKWVKDQLKQQGS